MINQLFFNHATTKADPISQSELSSMINAVDAQARVNNISSVIVDFDNHEMLYRTENLIYIDEATFKDFKRPCAIPYWSFISEETLTFLFSTKKAYEPLYELLDGNEYAHHICTIDYPIELRKRKIFIHQKFTPLYLRPDGITSIGLFSFSNSSKQKTDSMILTPSGKRFRFDFDTKSYAEFDLGLVLSFVEKAVMQRAKKGMTIEDIAKDLCISVNTIKTHRLRIFKKLGVNSINEALTIISNYQLI